MSDLKPPERNKGGRPATARRRKAIIAAIREGGVGAMDRAWLLEQLLKVYNDSPTRASDKLRALELMARLSGLGRDEVTPEDERRAMHDLIQDMENGENL